jgi:uncharacterized membrane protein
MRTLLSILFFAISIHVFAQSGTVHGIVLDESGAPVPYAELNISDSTDLKVTGDMDGRLELNLRPGRYEVLVAASGFDSSTEKIIVRKGEKSSMTLMLSG